VGIHEIGTENVSSIESCVEEYAIELFTGHPDEGTTLPEFVAPPSFTNEDDAGIAGSGCVEEGIGDGMSVGGHGI